MLADVITAVPKFLNTATTFCNPGVSGKPGETNATAPIFKAGGVYSSAPISTLVAAIIGRVSPSISSVTVAIF